MAALAEPNSLGPIKSTHYNLLDPPNERQIPAQEAKPVLSADQENSSSELSQGASHTATALEDRNDGSTVDSQPAADIPPVKKKRLRRQSRVPEDDDADSFVQSDYHSTDSEDDLDYRTRIASCLNQDELYKAYKARLERCNRGNDKAAALVKGFVDYMRSVEKRMEILEQGAPSNAEGAEDTETGKGETDEIQENRKELLEARFYHYSDAFDASGNLKDTDDAQEGTFTTEKDPAYLIRVVYDSRHNANLQAPKDSTTELNPNDIDPIMMTIESEPIASFFEKRLGFEMESKHTFRVAKPFRAILMNLDTIKTHLVDLERNFGTSSLEVPLRPTSGGASAANNASVPQVEPIEPKDQEANMDPYYCSEALQHFGFFVNFLHKYLAPKIDLQEKIRSAEVETIAYEDAWMLFPPGERIYCASRVGSTYINNHQFDNWKTQTRHVPQVYQVTCQDGGIPLRKTWASDKDRDDDEAFLQLLLRPYDTTRNGQDPLFPDTQRGRLERMTAENDKRKNHYSMLAVTCMNMAFTGDTFCTIADAFNFKPFEGQVNIRSLEAYPLRFLDKRSPANPTTTTDLPKVPATVDSLLERGKTFVDLTSFSHRLYEGLTVGMNKEEVNGAVVVDAKLAMLEYGYEFPDLKVAPMDISNYWAISRDIQFEILELSIPDCEDAACHKHCVNPQFHTWQLMQRDKLSARIKRILDEYEGESWDDPANLEAFSRRMEAEDLLILMPGIVPGFVLRNRNWVQLDIRRLTAIQERDDWNKLVLPGNHKKMVQAMVETHSRGSKSNDEKMLDKPEMDLVRGKGKGCIILLHGVPGVGKTSTAECVASYTGRPLYPITCGDIGYLPDEVEKNMGKHFKLAHRWGCVLLLDEADVFLAKRDKSDVKRNGLVSVFLRILEYYPGILFLTTNRVGYLDDAFRSRLHLTLFYPRLNKWQTTKIWKMNLDRLKDVNDERERKGHLRIKFDRGKILEWAKEKRKDLQWNGRQIRNAFQTAIALAEFEAKPKTSKKGQADPDVARAPKMKTSHFKTIAEASQQFTEYLALTHGEDEEDRAVREGTRIAKFQLTPAKARNRQPTLTPDMSDEESEDEEGEEDEDEDHDSENESEEDVSEDDEGSEESEEDKGKKSKKKSEGKSKSSKTGKQEKEKKKKSRRS